MDNVDFSFMRSGFNTLEGQTRQMSEHEQTLVLSILMVFMEKAMLDAAKYVTAASRTQITGKDMITALKLQALPQTGFFETEDLQAKVQECYAELFQTEDESDSEEEESDDVSREASREEGPPSPDQNDEDDEEWTSVDPTTIEDEDLRALCQRMNVTDALFATWEPEENTVAYIVKQGIESTERQFM
jgi:hypothetical protein